MKSHQSNTGRPLSRRAILKSMGLAPVLLRPAPFRGSSLLLRATGLLPDAAPALPFSDVRLTPRYPAASPLADVLRLVPPGSDEYITEKYAAEIEHILAQWSTALRQSPHNLTHLATALDASIHASTFSAQETPVRSSFGIEVLRRQFAPGTSQTREQFLRSLQAWLAAAAQIHTAEFEIYGITALATDPLTVQTEIRYDLVATRHDARREERVGSWTITWSRVDVQSWQAHQWQAHNEQLCVVQGPAFVDVTTRALGELDCYRQQLVHGADHWRTILDGAIGVDVYCNNGVAAGDYDNDGFDDLYICQPAGLPNRLLRNRGDGTFEDVTEKAGVGVLDSTACALFVDFDNRGLQDLLVVCGTGPLLFRNQGDGTFKRKPDAFRFANVPQGTFTHAAVADYDGDGRLDIYLCMYMYYLGLEQYHYPIPYYDARNGPPNCLFHNEGNGSFVETTQAAGFTADNDRYSFACAWGDSNGNGLPDLFIANDFGSSQLYRNNGDGTFTVVSGQAHVEGVGAGMSCCWCDFDNDGRQDIYVPSMWEAAGQRVSLQKQFHADAPEHIRELYQRHARGNALYRNNGDGTFENVGHHAAVEMGRWSWSSDFWDFDHDGYSDLYVSNGYISEMSRDDLASFFWRQVVAKSSEDSTPSLAYERGWNAINELIRSDNTWHGYARNVLFSNNHDGTFAEASGPLGLDFLEDSRSFALADIDHDGRLEIILKNRNAPQLRVLHNHLRSIGHSISFRLRGHKSNRDAIGTAITVEAEGLRQIKYLQAGSGFLAQHSKELFFGIGNAGSVERVTLRWPSGLVQHFSNLPANHRIIIEEGASTFTATPFAAPPALEAQPVPQQPSQPLPSQVETWLIEPLKAPDFSLPDLAGNTTRLGALQGQCVLLAFWSTASQSSLDQLRSLRQHSSSLTPGALQVLSINLDGVATTQQAHSFAADLHPSFPVLFASDEVAGIYNIIYRHMFDRRRDLAIPTSFLLDKQGMIVKVYQGTADPAQILRDAQSIPATAAERMQKALPFTGQLVQDVFLRNDFTYGVAMFQHGYLDQAAASFQQVIAAKPNNADAFYNLGTLYLRKNDLETAQRNLETTVRLQPDYPEAWNNLGMIAAQQGRADDAIQDFQKSLSLRPRYAIAMLNLGNVYRRQRDFAQAQDYLSRALKLRPDDPEINYSLGMLYAQQNQLQQAADYLQKAISLRPNYPEALNNLGVLYVRVRDYAKAEEQFTSGIRIAPGYDQSYLNLARLYVMQNDKAKALEVLHRLLAVQPQNETARQAMEMLQ